MALLFFKSYLGPVLRLSYSESGIGAGFASGIVLGGTFFRFCQDSEDEELVSIGSSSTNVLGAGFASGIVLGGTFFRFCQDSEDEELVSIGSSSTNVLGPDSG